MSSNNPRSLHSLSQGSPYAGGVLINYSGGDQTLAISSRAIYVSTTGALKVDFIDGTTATLTGLLVGKVYPFCVNKIYQTGSTAGGHALL